MCSKPPGTAKGFPSGVWGVQREGCTRASSISVGPSLGPEGLEWDETVQPSSSAGVVMFHGPNKEKNGTRITKGKQRPDRRGQGSPPGGKRAARQGKAFFSTRQGSASSRRAALSSASTKTCAKRSASLSIRKADRRRLMFGRVVTSFPRAPPAPTRRATRCRRLINFHLRHRQNAVFCCA